MADEPSTGVAEMKAVLLDLLHPGKPAHGDASDQGNQPMAGRDTHDSEHAHVPGRAGGRQDEKLNTTDDRPEEYGAGANQTAPAKDADSGNWPPKDWDENGNARRHGQSREGKGPGGYEDRSRELRDYGPGPEGSTGEAWRTYENHADGDASPDQQDGKARKKE